MQEITTKQSEGWMKPMYFPPITHFDMKSEKSEETHTFRNRYEDLSED